MYSHVSLLQVYSLNNKTGQLVLKKEIKLVSVDNNTGAEILLHSNRKWVYVSSRGVGIVSVFQLVDNDNILERVQEFRNGNDYLNLTKIVLIKLFLPDRHLAELDNRPSQDEGHLA